MCILVTWLRACVLLIGIYMGYTMHETETIFLTMMKMTNTFDDVYYTLYSIVCRCMYMFYESKNSSSRIVPQQSRRK